LGFNSHLTLFSSSKLNTHDILAIQGVRSIHPLIEKQGICASNRATSGAVIRCIPFDDLQKKKMVGDSIICGHIRSDNDDCIVIGHKLAQNLGVKCHDVITITAAEGRPSPLGLLPRTQDFKVSAIFDSGMHEYDSSMVFLPLRTGQDFFETPSPTSYEVFLNDLDHIDAVKTILQRKHIYARDWKSINSSLFKAIQVQSNVMFLILTLIVLVAAFNIMSGLIMLVKDKTKDIAILRTMGATQKSIILIFMMMGSAIGFLGTALGSVLGLLFAYNIDRIRQFLESLSNTNLFQAEIYFLSSLPSRVELSKTLFVVSIALLLTLLSTAYPAWKASRLHPARGLHYE
jgi:lipoprotein-releasing system permease protein